MSPLDSSKLRYIAFRQARRPSADATPARTGTLTDGPRRRGHYLREYRRWLWPYRGRVLTVFLLALLGAGLSMILPLVTRYVIDDVLPHPTLNASEKTLRLIAVCGAMLAVLLITQAIDTSRTYLMALLNRYFEPYSGGFCV